MTQNIQNTGSDLKVLLIEDDDGDAKAVRRAFQTAGIQNPVIRAIDGVDALNLLRGEQGYEKCQKPMIVLVDLNMPRMNGIELLKQIRADETLQDNIVFVLSTSNSIDDRQRAYQYNVAGYILKERSDLDCSQLTSMLENYWSIVELPQ